MDFLNALLIILTIGSLVFASAWRLKAELEKNREQSIRNVGNLENKMKLMNSDLKSWSEGKFSKAFERIEKLEVAVSTNNAEISKERHVNHTQNLVIDHIHKNIVGKNSSKIAELRK